MESSIERERLEKTTDTGEGGGTEPEMVSSVPWISHYVLRKDGKLTPIAAGLPWIPYKTRHGADKFIANT